MPPWLFDGELWKLFMVFPVFSAFVALVTGLRLTFRLVIPPWVMPAGYALALGAVLTWWGSADTAASVTLLRSALRPSPLGLVAAAVLAPLVVAVYLMELWMADKLSFRLGVGRTETLVDRARGRASTVVEQLADMSAIGMGGGPLPGQMSLMPSADDAFAAVTAVSRKPGLFMLLSVATATLEELLYRVGMLDGLRAVSVIGVAVVTQSVAYGVNHLAFGAVAVVSKIMLGIAFGLAVVITGSVIPALLGHLWFQFLVWRRIRRVDEWNYTSKQNLQVVEQSRRTFA